MRLSGLKLISLISVLLILSASLPALAQTQQTSFDVSPVAVRDFWGILDVEEGQKIAVKVKVGVQYESPKSLDGFWLKIRFKKPDGSYTDWKWYDFTDEYISRGSSKTYTVKTGVTADQVGWWTVYVELYDKDKEHRLNYDSDQFRVVEVLPAAWIHIEEVAGYIAVAGLILAGLYLARRGL